MILHKIAIFIVLFGLGISCYSQSGNKVIDTGEKIIFVSKGDKPAKTLDRLVFQEDAIKHGLNYHPIIVRRMVKDVRQNVLITTDSRKNDVEHGPQHKLVELSKEVSLYDMYGELLWTRRYEFPTDIFMDEFEPDFKIESYNPFYSDEVLLIIGGLNADELPNHMEYIALDGSEICRKSWEELGIYDMSPPRVSNHGKFIAFEARDSLGMKVCIWDTFDCRVKEIRVKTLVNLSGPTDEGVLYLQNIPSRTKEKYIFEELQN